MIYAILDSTLGLVKIGYTGRSARERLSQIKSSSGTKTDMRLLGMRDGDRRTESQMHQKFAHLHDSGEWFRLADDLQAWLDTLTPVAKETDNVRFAVVLSQEEYADLKRRAQADRRAVGNYAERVIRRHLSTDLVEI